MLWLCRHRRKSFLKCRLNLRQCHNSDRIVQRVIDVSGIDDVQVIQAKAFHRDSHRFGSAGRISILELELLGSFTEQNDEPQYHTAQDNSSRRGEEDPPDQPAGQDPSTPGDSQAQDDARSDRPNR